MHYWQRGVETKGHLYVKIIDFLKNEPSSGSDRKKISRAIGKKKFGISEKIYSNSKNIDPKFEPSFASRV